MLIIFLFVLVFGIFSGPVSSPDFWWHLKTGEYIAQTGSLPETDPFAHTSTPKDPVNPESNRIRFILTQYWLAQLIFYWVYNAFGFAGIIYLKASILTLLVLLTYIMLRREGAGTYLSITLLIPAAGIFYGFTGERPQLFSFLFSFLIVFLLEGFRKKASLVQNDFLPAVYYLLPTVFVMLLWANMHGGFILGIVIIITYIVCEWVKYVSKKFGKTLPSGSLRLLTITGFIAILASACNPNGYNVISVLLELGRSSYKDMITESVSPFKQISLGIYSPELILFFILLISNLIILFIHLKKIDLTDIVLLSGLAAMGFTMYRFIPFFAPVAVLFIARYKTENIFFLWRFKNRLQSIQPMISIMISAMLIFIVIKGKIFDGAINIGLFHNKVYTMSNKYPEGAVKFLKLNKPGGNMFNPYDWGGYLMWALYPDYKVFIDGRGLIENIVIEEAKIMGVSHENAGDLPEWKAYLNKHGITFIVTYSVSTFSGHLIPLIPAILHDPEWHLVYIDSISLIFLKDSHENHDIVMKESLPKEWLWNEVISESSLKVQGFWSSGTHANFYITIGDAFFALNQYSNAKMAYMRAREIYPQSNAIEQRLFLLNRYGY